MHHLRLSHRAGDALGLPEQLRELRDIECHDPAGRCRSTRGARHEREIRHDPRQLSLVHHLPVPALGTGADRGRATLDGAAGAAPDAPRPWQPRPLRSAGGPARWDGRFPRRERGLHVPAHRRLAHALQPAPADGGGAWLEDHSTYGTFVNDEPVRGASSCGSVTALRTRQPGRRMRLVQAVEDDGTRVRQRSSAFRSWT